MSDLERTGMRYLLYSRWHRKASTARYLGGVNASKLLAVDIDWCEACAYCKRPLALVETERSGRAIIPKAAPVTANLARAAGIPAYSVIYVPSSSAANCDHCGRPTEDNSEDVLRFYVRQVEPTSTDVVEMDPADYAAWLLGLRRRCTCLGSKRSSAAA